MKEKKEKVLRQVDFALHGTNVPIVLIGADETLAFTRMYNECSDCELFQIDVIEFFDKANEKFNKSGDKKLYIYYVFKNTDHIFYSFTGKFVGSYLPYDKLPEKCKMQYRYGETEIYKDDFLEVTSDNFLSCIISTFKCCFHISTYTFMYKVEPRNISDVRGCNYLFTAKGRRYGIKKSLYDERQFICRKTLNKYNMTERMFEDIFKAKVHENVKQFYYSTICTFEIESDFVSMIRNNELLDLWFTYHLDRSPSVMQVFFW